MKKNVIAVLLSVVMAVGSVGSFSVLAAETTAQEASEIAQEEPPEKREDAEIGMTDVVTPEEETVIIEEEPAEEAEDVIAVEGTTVEQHEAADTASTQEAFASTEEEVLDTADLGDTSVVIAEIEEPDVIEEELVTETVKEAAMAATSGECGDNATWKLEGSNNSLTLTISGNGPMYDYYRLHPWESPWYSRRESITKILIGKGITSIGDYAFYRCSNLTTITIPDSVKSIGKNAFAGCTSLKGITLPDGVITMGSSAFSSCSSLTSVKIPEGVVYTSENLFNGCVSLTKITFPSTLTTIGEHSFQDCTSLKNVILPIGVKRIEDNAFYECYLASVTIPNTVTDIGEKAFGNGEGLNIFFMGSKEQWDAIIGEGWYWNHHDYSTISFLLISNNFSVDADFQLSRYAYYYTGSPIETEVTVTYDGKELVEGQDYELTYENNIDIGMATVNVNGIGSYSGTAKLQFRIRLGSPTKVTCTNLADCMKVEWEKVPGATRYKVYRDDILIKTTSGLVIGDKDVRYEVGKKFTYKVVATNNNIGDSDLYRTCTYYRLLPVGVEKLTSPSAGKLTVTYGKCDGCYGYVVRYGKKSDMSDSKTLAVKGANTLTKTLSVEKGKTYYVQVRTYMLKNGTRYYSTYSRIKSVKVK